jgi:hypothetical protein
MYRQRRGLYPLTQESTRKGWKRLVLSSVGALFLAQAILGPMPALAATIQTDLFVYQNGDTVTVTGNGFGVTETVGVVTTDPNAAVVDQGTAATDTSGNFSYQFVLNVTVGGLYTVNATGQTSGLSASTQFDPAPTNPPTNLAFRDARATGGGVSLSWTPIQQQSVDCYFIYRSTTPMAALPSFSTNSPCATPHTDNTVSALAEVPATDSSYTDSSPPSGSLYYFVTGLKSGNNQGESPSSNEVTTQSLNPASGSASRDFGNTVAGTSSVFHVTYTNNGLASVTVVGPVKSGSNPGDFAISNLSPAAGTSVAVGAAMTFDVTFTPNSLGARSANIEINSRDTAGQASGVFNTHVMPVSGNGVAAAGLVVNSATGIYSGSATLVATLTSGGSGISGKPIQFSLNGTSVGSATTDASGVATLSDVSLSGINASTYPSGVGASFAGDASYGASNGTGSLTIAKAGSTTTVTCPTDVTFTGSPLTPCTASVSGAGGLSQSLTVSYSNNTNAGTATASANYPGDANHNSSSGSANFTIDKANSTTVVTCPADVTFTGSPLTPCTASVSGAGGLSQSLTVSYSNNTNAGTATASASYAGDANHFGSSDSKTFTIDKAAQVISFGMLIDKIVGGPDFVISAIGGPSGNPVTFASMTVGVCTLSGSTVHLISVGTCTITANQNGNSNYLAAAPVSQSFKVMYASGGTCDGDAGHAILQPINADGSSVFKKGSTVPAKFRVCDANGVSIGTPGVVSSFRLIQTNAGTVTNVDESVYSTTPDTAFRWDSTNQQWIFNISTTGLNANTTYVYVITLNDGSTIRFQFGLR